MDWLVNWYDWFAAVLHKPLGQIELWEVAGVIGTVVVLIMAIVAVWTFLESSRRQ